MFDPPKLPRIKGSMHPRFEEILTPEALEFVARLDGAHSGRRAELLAARRERGKRISAGETGRLPGQHRRHPRRPDWRVAPPAPGPGGPARARSPARRPQDDHQRAELRRQGVAGRLRGRHHAHLDERHRRPAQPDDALARQDRLHRRGRQGVHGSAPSTADHRGPAPRLALCREAHAASTARPLPGRLVDFGLYFFHNAQQLIDHGAGPYFYLPKLETHLEARLWNDVFVLAQELLGIPQGTIRATVLIETITAAFEMEEILYELRDHSAGLNAGRWDYIFSLIKNFAHAAASSCCRTARRSP